MASLRHRAEARCGKSPRDPKPLSEPPPKMAFPARSSADTDCPWRTTAPLRSAVTALAGAGAETPRAETPAAVAAVPAPIPPSASAETAHAAEEPLHRRAARYAWAVLLARIYEVLPLLCPKCRAEMRSIAFITKALALRQILAQLGAATSPPRLAPARGPPLWEMPGAGKDRFDPRPNQHRTTNSISVSRGRCHDKTKPWSPVRGRLVPGAIRPTIVPARVTPGIPRRAIPVILRERPTPSPLLYHG
jgi:hypothetical protein